MPLFGFCEVLSIPRTKYNLHHGSVTTWLLKVSDFDKCLEGFAFNQRSCLHVDNFKIIKPGDQVMADKGFPTERWLKLHLYTFSQSY